MRSAFLWVASVAFASVACESTPPPVAPPPPPPPVVAPPPPVVEALPPPPPARKLVTITTKSPDAKAALLAGWDLQNNLRGEEALEQCKKAVAADPDFALGHTCVGNLTSGAAGQAQMDEGVRLAAGLPEAERLAAEAFAALRRQQPEKYYANLKRVTELAPDDSQAFDWLGWSRVDGRDFRGAEAAFKRELELNPGASFAHGALMWIFTQQRRYDEALAAARRYVEGAPGQAGAHQFLGQALINVGQLKEADAELTKAVAAGPRARWAYYDLAEEKAITGDFAGAREVLDRSKATEVQATDGLERSTRMAWVLFAEGKRPEAFALLDTVEKDADERKLPWPAYEAAVRARALWALGQPANAVKAADAAMARCERPESSEGYKEGCRIELLTIKAFAQVRAGALGDARQTVDQLGDKAKKWPANDWLQTDVAMLSEQIAALSKKDRKAAAGILAKCPPDNFFWKFSVLRQLEKDGDKAGAEQVRKDLLGRPIKDMAYALIARLASK